MSKKLLPALIASLFAAAPAFGQSADDPMRVQATGTIGGIYNNTDAKDNAALFLYQDLGNGVLSNVGAEGRNSNTWFQGYGENFGRKDQYMFLRGGMYDMFKSGIYLNDIPHTFSSSASTPFVGSGGNLLTTTFPISAVTTNGTPPADWNSFRLGYDRRDVGGYLEWQKHSPWYFRADGSQVTFSGTKVGSAANGTSPGNGYTDLAIPQDFRTNNVGVEGGYQSNKATLSLRWDYSKFENANQTLRWTNPYFGPPVNGVATTSNLLDTTYLAPDNQFNKFTVSGNYRDLPWQSVISARYTWAKTTSDIPLGTTALNTNGVYNNTLPDEPNFNGENVNQSFQLAWTAMPATNFNTRVWYYWTKLQNKSDVVEYGDAPTTPLASGLGCGNLVVAGIPTTTVGNCENELYSYTKNNVGFDAWWRFAQGQRLGFGYDYNNIDQVRVDYDKSHDNKVWVEYKNTMFDTFSGRLKYQYLKRDSDLNYTNNPLPNGGANNPNYLLPYTSAFDLQSNTTNALKLILNWNPVMEAGLSFEGNWAKIEYDDVTYGRTENKKQGYFLSGFWNPSDTLKFNAFGSWEKTEYPSNHRYIGTVSSGSGTAPNNSPPGYCSTTNLNCYNPFAPPSANSSYNWNSGTKDTTWMVGVGADWQAMEALTLTGSYLYVSNEGNATFGYQPGGITSGTLPLPINNFDNSKQQFFNLKGIYHVNRNWSFTAGYSYLKYSHDDVATNGYQYVLPAVTNSGAGGIVPVSTSTTSLSFPNGYDAFTDGHSNLFYLTVTYKFDAPPLPVPPLRMAEAPKPVVTPPPPPPPPPRPAPPPAPQVQKITLDAKVLFGFNKSELTSEGKAEIDRQVIAKLAEVQKFDVVIVTGHTDRIGSEGYNQKLSEERAAAVGSYLASKGVDKAKIQTIGMGEKQPVVQCDQKNMKALIECLQPNRRVDVEVRGETRK
jgi:MtrB/PioB family decaheme-associated outer membrane protein